MEKKMTDKNQIIKEIRAGETSLGIEFGSTRTALILVEPNSIPRLVYPARISFII